MTHFHLEGGFPLDLSIIKRELTRNGLFVYMFFFLKLFYQVICRRNSQINKKLLKLLYMFCLSYCQKDHLICKFLTIITFFLGAAPFQYVLSLTITSAFLHAQALTFLRPS